MFTHLIRLDGKLQLSITAIYNHLFHTDPSQSHCAFWDTVNLGKILLFLVNYQMTELEILIDATLSTVKKRKQTNATPICNCKTGCKNNKCGCKAKNSFCSEQCKCKKNCTNVKTTLTIPELFQQHDSEAENNDHNQIDFDNFIDLNEEEDIDAEQTELMELNDYQWM